MSHILCITCGMTGILHASFEVVRRLQNDDHQVTYACPWDVKNKVEIQGFKYVQLPPVNFYPGRQPDKFSGRFARARRIMDRLRNARKYRNAGVQSLNLGTFEKTLSDLKPDILLLDLELHDYIIYAVAKGYKIVLLSPFFNFQKNRGLPPLDSLLIPGRDWKASWLALEWSWFIFHGKHWLRSVKEKVKTVFTDRSSVLMAFAKQVGFPNDHFQQFGFIKPFTYHQIPVISMTDEQLEFPYAIKEHIHYAGPMVFASRKEESPDPETDALLEKVITEKQNRGKPLIYCNTTTVSDVGDRPFLKIVVEAFARKPDWLLVIGLGGILDPSFLGSLPPNVFVFRWAPQLRILKHADISINPGGINTINECIHFNVPMLVYPENRTDQNGNAARTHFHGLGIMANRSTEDPGGVIFRINQLLADPIFKKNMGKANKRYLAYMSDRKLEKLIKRMMFSRPKTSEL